MSLRVRTMPIGAAETSALQIRWNWILSCRGDLTWFIGSASVGWLYIALVLALGRGLSDPLHDTFYTLSFAGATIALTLELAVFASWAFLVDSPHLWATLARTYFDPDEWLQRRQELVFSLVWFIAGPAAVLGPYLAGTVVSMSADTMALGGLLFFTFFRLWAYYHVIRQHWGFFILYKRKNDDLSNPIENRIDFWFFNLSLYLPLLIFISTPGQSAAGFVDIELVSRLVGSSGILNGLHSVTVVLYVSVVIAYLTFQLSRWRQGIPRNGPKLLFLLSIVPLHYAVFLNPLLALFVVPIVTVGHNLQYHRIVWMYGRNKYCGDDTDRYRFTRPIFRHLWVYILLGALFTFGFSRGPWINFLAESFAFYFDSWIFPGIGMIAGIVAPESAGVGAEVVALFLTGWSMHHYYLDSKIWRVSRDPYVAKSLGL